jgi:hypothetical protein
MLCIIAGGRKALAEMRAEATTEFLQPYPAERYSDEERF